MYDNRNKNNIVEVNCRTTRYGIDSFTYQRAKLLNELNFKCLLSIKYFKGTMASFNDSTCTCSYCTLYVF